MTLLKPAGPGDDPPPEPGELVGGVDEGGGRVLEVGAVVVVGVFVGEDNPSQPGDAVVDLSDADNEAEQEPDLGEPFFIGDGETADGDLQEIVVPDDATTLYLGFADAFSFVGAPGAYGDNHGTVDIEVTID